MTRAHLKRIALIAAAALLFSALSPAMAAMLFAQRPDILARVLRVPAHHEAAAFDATHDDGCPHEPAAMPQHGDARSHADDTSEHATHGIFCSFCLAAATWMGMPSPPPGVAAPPVGHAHFIPAGEVQAPLARPRATRHPRDPPLPIVLS